jgi:hypothetical protein
LRVLDLRCVRSVLWSIGMIRRWRLRRLDNEIEVEVRRSVGNQRWTTVKRDIVCDERLAGPRL